MINHRFFVLSLFALSLLAATSALNVTQKKGFFYVSPDNNLSYDISQTRNGIISHSLEGDASKYTLIDLPSREAKSILTDLVKVCDPAIPSFQNLHYHVPTDSLVYFCSQNNSLLVLDQSSYAVQATIPFDLQGKWPVAKLSTDGMNIAVLLIGELFTTTPQASVLVKVDFQAKQISAIITLNQFLESGEAVVAFVSNKKSAYVATNRLQGTNLTTVIYSFVTIGNTYQLIELSRFSSSLSRSSKFVTKLSLVGNIVAVNNAQDLYFINEKGIIQTVEKLAYKSITNSIFDLAVTSQYDSNDFYYFVNGSAFKFTVTASITRTVKVGEFADMQIAYGNQTSEDLMFTLDSSKISFSILDLKTLKPVYNSLATYNTNIMLANTTYSIIQAGEKENIVYIFNLTTDSLLFKIPFPKNYTYTPEQWKISYLNRKDATNCTIKHIDLEDGEVWENLWFEEEHVFLCDYSLSFLKTEDGFDEFVIPVGDQDYVRTALQGLAVVNRSSYAEKSALISQSSEGYLYAYGFMPGQNGIAASRLTYQRRFGGWTAVLSNFMENISANKGFFSPNGWSTFALSNDSLSIIRWIGRTAAFPVKQFPASAHWNSITFIHDDWLNETRIRPPEWAILSKDGFNPAVLSYEDGYTSLPGLRSESIRANAANYRHYWIEDAPSLGVRSVRFFMVNPEIKKNETSSYLRPVAK